MATEPILHLGTEIKRRETTRPAWIADTLSRSWVKKLFLLTSDVIAVMAAHYVAEILTRRWMNLPVMSLNPSGYFLFYFPFFTVLLYLLEGYRSFDVRRPEKELELVFKGVSFSFMGLTCANFVLFKSLGFSRYLVVVWYILALLFLLVGRFSLRAMYALLWSRGLARQKALLLGSAGGLVDLQRRLSIQLHQGYEIAGILVELGGSPLSEVELCGLRVRGDLAHWEQIADAEGVRLVIVHLEDSSPNCCARILEIVRRCQEKGIEVEVYSKLFGVAGLCYARDEFSGCFHVYSPPRWSRAVQRAVKASLDILIGLIGSAITLMLVPIIGLLLKWEDGGATFHRREYIGTDGCIHHFLKFRTMVEDAEQILKNDPVLKAQFDCSFKLKEDPRVLKVGRFLRKYSLDEFPQFFSVLTGQLTFVGPRAITPDACERYGQFLPKLLSMKPGLTGFWQVMGRQTTSYEEKIQMDMFYVDQWSIWLDLVIVAKTFSEVLRAKGAY